MAQVVSGNQIKLNNGQTVTAQQGGWYDAQQFWNGTLSTPGVINSQSNQQGAGQAVSPEVVAQTDKAQGLAPGTNEAYIAQQQQQQGNAPAAGGFLSGGGGGAPATGSTSGGVGFSAGTASINLPDLYNTYTQQAGIPDLEKQLTTMETAFNTATSQINDNPFLSEADRTGRIEKLTTDYNNSATTVQNQLTMAKQDVATQLQLQTQQFDINSQTAQQALSEFNMLLSSGALAGASGQDIANITAATGISSTEIQAAIRAQTIKDTPTSVMTVDDGTGQYAVVMNTQTGAIISKQYLGASKPVGGSAAATTLQNQQAYTLSAQQAAASGVDLQTLSENYVVPGGLTAAQVLSIYNEANYYGQTANINGTPETAAQVEAGQFQTNQVVTPKSTNPVTNTISGIEGWFKSIGL